MFAMQSCACYMHGSIFPTSQVQKQARTKERLAGDINRKRQVPQPEGKTCVLTACACVEAGCSACNQATKPYHVCARHSRSAGKVFANIFLKILFTALVDIGHTTWR